MFTPPRVDEPELLDEDDAPRADMERSLRDLRRINRWLGGIGGYRRVLEKAGGGAASPRGATRGGGGDGRLRAVTKKAGGRAVDPPHGPRNVGPDRKAPRLSHRPRH